MKIERINSIVNNKEIWFKYENINNNKAVIRKIDFLTNLEGMSLKIFIIEIT